MKALRIAKDFTLPAEAVTQTFAILAKRGVGKTYTGAVMVEEMLKAGLPVVIADPIGVWWGLRAGADGGAEGLPIVVLGGDHGDAPLEPTSGEVIADLVVEERLSVVLDLSLMRKGEQQSFMTAFCERLYHKNREALHLMLDEADAWAPQNPLPGTQRLLGAIEDLVRRGRARGIGVTLITQRAAVLNKNVLTQVEVLVTLRMIAPQDRKAVDDWINVHGTVEQRKQLMDSLPSLPIGTAWFWSPGWLDVFQRVQVRKRETFDSSATPKVGATVRQPKKLAEVDLEKLRERMSATIEKARQDDPRELRRQIAELKRQVATPASPAPVSPKAMQEIREAAYAEGWNAAFNAMAGPMQAALTPIEDRANNILGLLGFASEEFQRLKGEHTPPAPAPMSQPVMPPFRRAVPPPPSSNGNGNSNLAGGERKILTVLAQYQQGRTKTQIALITGYAHNGGGFNNYLSALRSKGLIEGSGDSIRITSAGLNALGHWTPLPTGRELIAYWLGQVGKAERAVLQTLTDYYPRAISKDELGRRTGYEPNGGGFNNALSRLRTLDLIEGRGEMRASGVFFE